MRVEGKEREREREREVTDSLYQVVVLHVKVKDNAICKHIGKVGHEAEGGKMIQGTEIGKKRQRNQQCEQVYSTMRVGGGGGRV